MELGSVDTTNTTDRPSLSPPETAADRALDIVHYFSPIILFFFFLIVFIIRSIQVTTPLSTDNGNGHTPHPYGPGGKALPQRKATGLMREMDKKKDFPRSQKLVFVWLMMLATFTFVVSGVLLLIHWCKDHNNGWWCGQPVIVGP